MKKILSVLVLVLLAAWILWFFDDLNINSKDDLAGNQEEPKLSGSPNDQPAKPDKIKENDILLQASQASTEFDYLSLDEKIKIRHHCSEYFYNFDKGIDSIGAYTTNYYSVNNVEPTDVQLSALKKIITYCNKYNNKRAEIESLFNQQQDYGGGKYRKKLIELAKNTDANNAVTVAEDGLFYAENNIRLGSLQYLVGIPEWVDSLNEELNISNGYSESRSLIVGAHGMRMCELNLLNCSANSPTMLNLCSNIPQACGVSMNEHFLWTLTGYEIEYINDYLSYLRAIGG